MLTLLLGLQTLAPIWIEAESPDSANVKFTMGAPGRPELLSAGKWLGYSLDEGKLKTEFPAEGALFTYAFAGEGKRELWHRVGYEGARPTFLWRIDGGPWTSVGPSVLTQDMQELAPWNQVAWMKLGNIELFAGNHKLEVRLIKPEKGGILYGSDAFAFTAPGFKPYGKFKPGENPRTDRDRAAEARTFVVPNRAGPERQTIELDGDWEIARDDEITDVALVATPMRPLNPSVFTAIAVPGDKAEKRPDLAMAHRVWYRTRFTVPKGQADRSYSLIFKQNSLNTTVLINGKLVGFNKNPFVKWSCDATPGVKEGVNEILVGIRDAWYGFEQDPKEPSSIRKHFAMPSTFQRNGFLLLHYPVWNCFKSGLLDTPELTVGGRTFAHDVFVKPSVAKKRLDADVTLRNNGADGTATVELQAYDPDTKGVVKEIATRQVSLKGGEEKTFQIGGEWADPTLWWPDRPKMYHLRTIVSIDGKPVDQSDTPFGFREWTWNGPKYYLNGYVWHGWADLNVGRNRDEWLANYKKTKQRFQRMSGPAQNGGDIFWQGMPYDAALDWCDLNGVQIRRSGPLDGEMIGYMAVDEKTGGINEALVANCRDQFVAQVKGERNHPSINVWSYENEWLYINCINLYSHLMDQFEADVDKTMAAIEEVDPTRLTMTDGGGAGKNNTFPIHGDHYVFTNNPNDYPHTAYTDQPTLGGRGRWVWNKKQPRYAGEDFFATGINPADYAWIQGEEAFGGKAAAHRGIVNVQRMLNEGYRWGDEFTAWHHWVGDEGKQFRDKWLTHEERAVFVRQWDASFGSGRKVTRTLGVFNDSHFTDPITLDWTLIVSGKPVQKGTKTLSIVPGTNQKFDVTLQMPAVATRRTGKLVLDLKAKGQNVFHDEKLLVVQPETAPAASKVALYDPNGAVAKYLTAKKVPFRPLNSLANLPSDIKTLVVGPNALTEAQSTDPALAAHALNGHRVIVLDQTNPLKFGGLPTDLEPTAEGGAFGFIDDATQPAVKNLSELDLRAWGQNGRLYEKAYRKATKGVRSLVQVGPRLSQTALAEVPVGKGVMLLCQLQVGKNLANGGPASVLFSNLVDYAANYQRIERPVFSAIADPQLAKALDGTGIRSQDVKDPLRAISGPAGSIAVVSATPANLKTLTANLPKVRAFTAAGGQLVLNGLTPEGMADYNKIVGVQHMIRPFRREKTAIATPRDPLTMGMTQGDVVMYSGEKMFDFNDDRFVASDIFSYVVDTDDVAPFAKLPNDYFYNTVNGFVSSDGWKYIFSFELANGQPPEYTMSFPRPLSFREMTWVGNGFYHKVKELALTYDGAKVQTVQVEPNTEPQTLNIKGTGKDVKLSILDWTKGPNVNNVVGIDNVYLRIDREPSWYQKVRPLLNVGGLVRYPQGKGGVVLANLLFKESEEVPVNATKKRAILGAILRNLGAASSGGANMVVAGAKGINYTPVSLAGKATAYRNERGWFGDAKKTMADLPTGRQTFGSVPFDVYDFPTSPVPTAVVLGGNGVPGNLPERVDGIKVGTKASALFFLHTARIDQRRNDQERGENKRYEMARYVVTYADGSVVKVPVYAEIDVDDYRQATPRDLPGARVAWSKPFASGEGSATAYLMQWTNPRPELTIVSVGLEYGPDRRGVPALLAITAAK